MYENVNTAQVTTDANVVLWLHSVLLYVFKK